MVVAFRRHTLLPLDDCLYTLQPTVPHSRDHRCLQRHRISRLPEVEGSFAEQKVQALPPPATPSSFAARNLKQALPDRLVPHRSGRGPDGRRQTLHAGRHRSYVHVELMNRTIKDAAVKRFHYDNYEQFEHHLADFVSAYNFGRRLKTLKGLMPYEFICKRWTTEPRRLRLHPLQQMPELNI